MIDITNESGEAVDEKELRHLARFALDLLHIHKDAELSITLVDEDTMTAYHEKFLDEPGPTDVMSFPMDELHPGIPGKERPNGVLGDIVLCPSVTAKQAESMGRTPAQEQNYLLIHGLLHLLGFDHAEPEDKAIMFGMNDKIIEAWEQERA